MRNLLRLIYPPRCLACNSEVAQEGLLCASCRRDTPFVLGAACSVCGLPLPGEADTEVKCDGCLSEPRPWSRGRAVMAYSGQARRLVLAFKHGDRPELGTAFAPWLAARVQDIVTPETLVVPVPIHPLRLMMRKFNQSAVLANSLAEQISLQSLPDALQRTKRTPPLEGRTRSERQLLMTDAIHVRAGAAPLVDGADILLVDDVMTTGATLSACCHALRRSGAKRVCVVVLARVALDT